LALLGAIVIARRPRALILTFVGLLTVLALLDQTRWQPWVYQYLFMFGALGLGCIGDAELLSLKLRHVPDADVPSPPPLVARRRERVPARVFLPPPL
jgi:hypothetical protein